MSRALLLALASGSLAGVAQGQYLWSNPAGGSWFTPTNWSPVGVPSTAADTATLSLAGVYSATIDTGSFSLGGLTVSNPTATVQIGDNRILGLNGNVSNDGTIAVNTGSGGGISRFRAHVPAVTLTGSGAVVLNASANLDTAVMDNIGGASFTNSSGHMIRGTGNLYAILTNGGLVQADIAGKTLQLLGSPKTNNATFRANTGATLRVSGIGITQGVNGRIIANGGTVRFGGGVSVTGGRLQQQSGGVFEFGDGFGHFSTLTGVEIIGTTNVLDNANVAIVSGLTNSGRVVVNSGTGGNITRFRFNESTSVVGTGEVVLQASANLDTAIIDTAGGGITGTFGPGQKVRGTGSVDAPIINDGIISADQDAKTLRLRSGAKTNNNRMEAVGGGHLRIESIALTQGVGAEVVADAATVRFGGSNAVAGGTVRSAGIGFVEIGDGFGHFTTATGVTFLGDIRIIDNANLGITGGATNNASIRINTGSGGNNTRLRFNSSDAIAGTGEVILMASANLDTSIIDASAGVTGVFGPGQWVHGTGTIDAPITNNGLVSADQAGMILRLRHNSKTNSSVMEAVDQGQLRIESITIAQDPDGEIVADDQSVVRFGGTTGVVGGALITQGSGVLEVGDGFGHFCTLTGVELLGLVQVLDNANVAVVDAFTNNGTVRVNTGAGGNNARFRFNNPCTVSGAGEIVLQATGNLDTAVVDSAGGSTGTFGPGQVVRGTGTLDAPLVIEGVVRADQAGQTLRLRVAGKTNQNLIEATGGGQIRIEGIAVTQDPGAEIVARDQSVVRFGSGTAVNGGTLRTAGTGVLEMGDGFGNFNVLNGVTLVGEMRVLDNANIAVTNGLINNGQVLVNNGAGGNNTRFRFSTSTTVTGNGQVVLRASGNLDTAIVDASVGGLTGTFGPGITLKGNGRIHTGVVVQGTLAPGLSIGRLEQAVGTMALAPTTQTQIELAGAAAGQFDTIGGNATKALDGTLVVTPINGHVPTPAESYVIVTGPITGQFKQIQAPAPANPLHRWRVFYTPTSATLRIACYADCEGDGDLDVFDYLCFQGEFAAQTIYGDCEGDGDWDVFDFLCFQGAFAQGCAS